MIRKLTRRVTSQLRYAFCSGEGPKLYGSNKSILSLSQWWGGKLPHPVDYYIQDTLDTEVMEKWDVEKSIFRVVFQACLSDPSMDININHLKKSMALNQLIQLEGKQKEQLVDNPATIIIKPIFALQYKDHKGQIAKNMLELDKLFQSGVGLKIAYLIDTEALQHPEYLEEISKRYKAVSADVELQGTKLADLVFQHGYRLEHVFYSSPFAEGKDLPKPDLEQILAAMLAVNFKGKLILSAGEAYSSDLQAFNVAASKTGFSSHLSYSLQTDGWHTLT